MAIVVASGATPRSFTSGNFTLATLQSGPSWTFPITPTAASGDSSYSGFKALLATNDDGGLYLVNQRVEFYNGAGGGTLTGNGNTLTWSAGQTITITINLAVGANASSIVVSGATTGNGTSAFTASGTYFTASTLGVGQFTNSGTFTFPGTIGAVTDGVTSTSGTATNGGIASSGSMAVSVATSGTATCGGITSTGTIASPNPNGISACGGITSAGVMAVTVLVSGASACGGISSVGSMSGGSLWGTIGASGIGQRADVTGPATGTFSTQFVARVPSATVLINDRLVFNSRRWHVNLGGTLSAGSGPSGATGVQSDGTALVVPVNGDTELTMTTQPARSVMLAWVMRDRWASDSSAPTDNKGNTYSILGTSHAYNGFASASSAMFRALNITGGSNHIVSATWPANGGVGAECSLLVVEIPTGSATSFIVGSGFVELPAPGGGTLTSPSVVTNGPAMVVGACLGGGNVATPIGSSHTGTPQAPYLLTTNADGRVSIHANGYIQGQVAYFFAATPGTHQIMWNTTEPAHLYIAAVQEVAWVSTSGTTACGGITSAGSAAVTTSISGATACGGISSGGSVAVTSLTSGTAACGGITSTGSVVATAGTVSGTAACGGITSSGVTTLATSGTAAAGGIASSGTVAVSTAAAGAATCGGISSAGAVAITVFASGAAACGGMASSGLVGAPGIISGASACGGMSSAGAVAVTSFVSGTASCGGISSSGIATGSISAEPRPLPATIAISVVGAAPFRMAIE